MPSRLCLIVAALIVAVAAAPGAASAQSAPPVAHKVPMHPNTLTLRGRTRHNAPGHHRAPTYVHSTFSRPPHIHGTMAGPRM